MQRRGEYYYPRDGAARPHAGARRRVRTVLAKPGVECSPPPAWFAASERERTHKPQTRRSAPMKMQPSHPRGGQTRFMINLLTGEPIFPAQTANQYLAGEPILPAQTANQYLARYWFAVCAGKRKGQEIYHTYHKRLFRGPSTNGIKKKDIPTLSWPTPHTTPFFLPPEDPFRS